jgi:cysteine desulfurase
LITPDVSLVSVMLANHETGELQPLSAIAALCRERNVLLHTDAVQAIGKIPVNFRSLDVAAMTIAPHKFHGPIGIGGLLLRHGVSLQPQLFGGFQQAGLRPGTELPPLAVGFQTAVELWDAEGTARTEQLARLRAELQTLLVAGDPTAVVIGGDSPRLPHTLNIAFPKVDRQALLMALDLAEVACSTGSACASGSSELSPTLLAMGIPECLAAGAIRCSLGVFTTAAEVALGADRILRAVNQLRRPTNG